MMEAAPARFFAGDAVPPWGDGLFSDLDVVRAKKRPDSAARKWPAECGRRGMKKKYLDNDSAAVESPVVVNPAPVMVVPEAVVPEPIPDAVVPEPIPDAAALVVAEPIASGSAEAEEVPVVAGSIAVSADDAGVPVVAESVAESADDAAEVAAVPVVAEPISVAVTKREFPRRRVSAGREWPEMCGRSVVRVGREECLRRLAGKGKIVLPPVPLDGMVLEGDNDDSSKRNRAAEVQHQSKAHDFNVDEGAEDVHEKVGVTANPLHQSEVVDLVDLTMKVKEESEQVFEGAGKQVEDRTLNGLKQSQDNGQGLGLNKAVNAVGGNKQIGKAALSRSSLPSKEAAVTSEQGDGLNRAMALEVKKSKQKVGETSGGKNERAVSRVKPLPKEAKFRDVNVSSEELRPQPINQKNSPGPVSNPSLSITPLSIREPTKPTDCVDDLDRTLLLEVNNYEQNVMKVNEGKQPDRAFSGAKPTQKEGISGKPNKNVDKLPQSVSKSKSLSKVVDIKNKVQGDKTVSPLTKKKLVREQKAPHPSDGLEAVLALKAADTSPWTKSGPRAKLKIATPDSNTSIKKRKRNIHSSLNSVDEVHNSQSPSPAQVPENMSLAIVPFSYFSETFVDDVFSEGYDTEDNEDTSLYGVSHEKEMSLVPFGTTFGKSGKNPSADGKEETVSRWKVKATLRMFHRYCRRFLQAAEKRDKKVSYQRVDLKAYEALKKENKFVNTGRPILGTVPGVEVGDEFHFRLELCIIGLHRLTMAGIDSTKENPDLATSIVSSGGYDDKIDDLDVMVYTGQGGRPSAKNTLGHDQQLRKGNLALKNSIDAGTPVRVIRGSKEKLAREKKLVYTYTYVGLYIVENYWQARGRHGFMEYKFQLRRIPGQPPLAVREARKIKRSKAREGVCVADISGGKEMMPICAVNTIDDEKPPLFNYITEMIYPPWCSLEPPQGCSCVDGCSDSERCICAVKNGGEIPYNYSGSIVDNIPVVYECGPKCQCAPSCHNRVSQNGIKFKLEIFKTEKRGWGVRSLTSIPSGSFICEYIGELLSETEADQRLGNDEYLFDIGQTLDDGIHQDEVSDIIPDAQNNSICEIVEGGGFTIDAATYGNIGRFINHSCSPNIYAQNIFYDHGDKRLPHIMLFALDNIPPLQELTYDYNYTIDQVLDPDGNIKKKECFCGASECTGRMY